MSKKMVEKRTANARRVAEHRARQRAVGLVSVMLPADVAAEIKAAGGFDAWMDNIRDLNHIEIVREGQVSLTAEQKRLIRQGEKLENLPSWKKTLLKI